MMAVRSDVRCAIWFLNHAEIAFDLDTGTVAFACHWGACQSPRLARLLQLSYPINPLARPITITIGAGAGELR